VQLAGQHQDAVHPGVMAKPMVGLPCDSGRSNAEQVNRTELSFRLPEGLIVAVGLTKVAHQDEKIKTGQPSQRVILGGTDRYAGVRGVLSTVRREGSSFEHQFHSVTEGQAG
jgi:hypothetical protein